MYNKVDNAKEKVAFNTCIMYGKMALLIGISLYTVRVLLNNLGISNYGIFTLSAGLITVFSFLNSAMSISTQRYLSYYQGTGNTKMQNSVFYSSIILHIIVALISILILLIIMPYLFNGFLNIDDKSIPIARMLYIYMLISLFFTIISVPFVATLFSRENILLDSIILIIQAIMKLIAAHLIIYYPESEKLSFYGLSLSMISGIIFLFYVIYCCKSYKECRINKNTNSDGLLKEMASFAGWNLYTNLCYVLNTQGLNIVLNIFLGTTINAAYGIASQINGQVRELSLSLLRALNPQIMKSEGMEKRERTIRLSMLASKLGFFLVSIVGIPAIFTMSEILKLWLNIVPSYTDNICIYLLIASILNQLTVGITSAIQAIGDIKKFQLLIGSIALITLPFSYLLLKLGNSIYSVLTLIILIEVITSFIKIYFFSKISKFSALNYFRNCFMHSLLPLALTTSSLYLLNISITTSFNWIICFILMFLFYPPLFYLIGFDKNEKSNFKSLLKKIKFKN
ncbi:MATE family efflux transporter [Proteus terrae]|uniref:MATE family efflux transporter n=1 Tax=Proteus terrae TaxID=1574161 RepID=UPI0018C5FC6D|nr:MATE family efflux transporter [Proteus terrae]MBG2837005.1 MATE family efflux transporter [Proteus terrae subsp. cibarius]MBG2868670.1 MATE family efflux transporter [Proteus terrae subsp. cibarius]